MQLFRYPQTETSGRIISITYTLESQEEKTSETRKVIVPTNFTYVSVDRDGDVYAYEDIPHEKGTFWNSQKFSNHRELSGFELAENLFVKNWTETLINVEDAKEINVVLELEEE